jgi:hypothetical protein
MPEFFQYLTTRELEICGTLGVLVGLACIAPKFGSPVFDRIEAIGTKLAKKKNLAIFLLGLAPIPMRLALLPIASVPKPTMHDEFSYLLAADTFSHGRLTNPPHPLWRFFDTIHVNQHPSYMSKFPPAQGAVLGLGQIFGHPWIGVVLSVGVMCGAMLWMFQGWLPPSWALVAGVLVVLRVGMFSYWMSSYWGGAVPAIGGALVVGALPRIVHSLKTRHGIALGLGTVILMNSRPFEGLVLCAPALSFLVLRLVGGKSPPAKICALRLFLPFCLLTTTSLAFVGFYNFRGTGSALLMPYMLNERTYLSTPTLLWQKARPAVHFENPQLEEFYNGWSHGLWTQTSGWNLQAVGRRGISVLSKFVYFFMWPELCVPLLAAYWIIGDRRVRLLLVEAGFWLAGSVLIAWFQPHYAAPALSSILVLISQCLRHIRRWEIRGRPIGIGITRAVVLSSFVLVPFHPHTTRLNRLAPIGIELRAAIEEHLEASGSQHLIIVHYSSKHLVLEEWVYNRADIDNAKVVWARDIPGMSLRPLLEYYANRRIWTIEPDSPGPKLVPYPPTR